jgi:polysaccharide export outer membrane protein
MFKTPKDFSYDTLVDSLSREDYKIARNDILVYRLFANNGLKLINISMEPNQNALFRNEVDAVVESTDSIKMPLLGRVKIAGLTMKEAEMMLQEKYSAFYVEPFVTLKVSNRRVIVFPGNGGQARILPLINNNTTIVEALAGAGGILEDGKAYKVKLVRNNPDPNQKPFVYMMDLSRIDGIRAAQSIVQAGDIIYVEPRYRPLLAISREIAPIITLLTSVLILYQFSRV